MLNFNIYAFVKPETSDELTALLEEALRVADELSEQIDIVFGKPNS